MLGGPYQGDQQNIISCLDEEEEIKGETSSTPYLKNAVQNIVNRRNMLIISRGEEAKASPRRKVPANNLRDLLIAYRNLEDPNEEIEAVKTYKDIDKRVFN